MPTWSSPRTNRLDTPDTPAIRFTRAPTFAASLVCNCYGLSGCSPPLDGSDWNTTPATGGFYVQASDGAVTLPVAGYDYDIDWTPMSAGLAPAGMAASFAALTRQSVSALVSRLRTNLDMCFLVTKRRATGTSPVARSRKLPPRLFVTNVMQI